MTTHHQLIPAFVLHSRLYHETSMLLTLFTQHHGKISAIARGVRGVCGVRKSRSKNAGLLMPFMPLLVTLRGKTELLHLQTVEAAGAPYNLRGRALLFGMYVNELLVRLLHSHDDSYLQLYQHYCIALQGLSVDGTVDGVADDVVAGEQHVRDSRCACGACTPASQQLLVQRRAVCLFEKHLLQDTGYGLDLQHTALGEAIESDGYYSLQVGVGLVRVPSTVTHTRLSCMSPSRAPSSFMSQPQSQSVIRGSSVIALRRECPIDRGNIDEINGMLSKMLYHLIGEKVLQWRKILAVV